MNIDLSDEQMQSIVSGAILQAMGTEARDTVMKAAIEYLITPLESRSYGSKTKTPLQVAFEEAVNRYAQRAAYEYMDQNAEARDQIRSVFVAAYEKMITDYNQTLIEKIAQHMADALTKDRY